jgi:hypothetical protein
VSGEPLVLAGDSSFFFSKYFKAISNKDSPWILVVIYIPGNTGMQPTGMNPVVLVYDDARRHELSIVVWSKTVDSFREGSFS